MMQGLRWSIPQSRKKIERNVSRGNRIQLAESKRPRLCRSRSYSIALIIIDVMPILIRSVMVRALASNAINGTRSAAFTIFLVNYKISRDYDPLPPIVKFYRRGRFRTAPRIRAPSPKI